MTIEEKRVARFNRLYPVGTTMRIKGGMVVTTAAEATVTNGPMVRCAIGEMSLFPTHDHEWVPLSDLRPMSKDEIEECEAPCLFAR